MAKYWEQDHKSPFRKSIIFINILYQSGKVCVMNSSKKCKYTGDIKKI